jgi:hypothetical protein
MPLLDILTDIAMEVGKTNSDAEKQARIYRLNKAAKEIYNTIDAEECLREEVFDFAVDSQQVALPPYIGRVRGMRFYDGRQAISLDDIRNRYNFNFSGENELWYLQWRKKESKALAREISNQSILLLSIPVADTIEFTVTVTGKTDKSERISETLTFAIGDLEHETTENFVEVESIVKSKITKYNVSVYDVEDNFMGEVLNSEYKSEYQIYQVADTDNFTDDNFIDGVEVWFKYKLQPFRYDQDCFLGTDKFDDAIYWKYMEQTSKKLEDAMSFQKKCSQVLTQIFQNDQAGQRTKINFKPNAFLNLPYNNAGRFNRTRT